MRNMLTFAHKIKVTDWLRTNREKLLKDRPTFESLAKNLSYMLEVKLSGQSLRRLLAGIELDWHPAHQGDGGNSKWSALCQEVQRLSCRLASLELQLGVKNVPVVQQNLPLPKGV